MALSIGRLGLTRGAAKRRRPAPQPRIARRDPRRFGRRGVVPVEPAKPVQRRGGEDLRLFALTFAGGFIFMSVFIA